MDISQYNVYDNSSPYTLPLSYVSQIIPWNNPSATIALTPNYNTTNICNIGVAPNKSLGISTNHYPNMVDDVPLGFILTHVRPTPGFIIRGNKWYRCDGAGIVVDKGIC